MIYLVIEMQTNDGVTSTLTYQFDSLSLAEQKYYLILSSASVSTLEVHGAMIVDQYLTVLKKEKFVHIQPEPEPPEPEEEE